MAQPPSSPKMKNKKTADQYSSSGWTKYINLLGLLGFVTAIVYINPLTSDAPIIARANQFLKRATGINFQHSSSTSPSEAAFLAKYANGCPAHKFSAVKIVSRAPDIMVIENFVTPEEADYLVKFAEPIFEESRTVDYDTTDGSKELDKQHRDSQSAYLPFTGVEFPRYEPIRCIEERAAQFQGHVPIENFENLQVVRYGKGNYFREHFDWFDPDRDQTLDESGNRATSFFVYLVADCEGGTTVFPKVPRPAGEEWCDLLKCRDGNGTDVTFLEVKATVGTAIFWQNFDSKGVLDRGTLHAGTDVLGGTKVGLNIWTREKKYR